MIYKLLGFTFAMIVFPIGSYFFTLKTVFNGKPFLTAMGLIRARRCKMMAAFLRNTTGLT